MINYSLSNMSVKVVKKRNGEFQPICPEKITKRIREIVDKFNLTRVDVNMLAEKALSFLVDGILTSQLDIYIANTCNDHILDDPEYDQLASGIYISNLHKNTRADFCETVKYYAENKKTGLGMEPAFISLVEKHRDEIQGMFDFERDYQYSYFGIKTLDSGYLNRIQVDVEKSIRENRENRCQLDDDDDEEGDFADEEEIEGVFVTIERPQHLMMRVALQIHGSDMQKVKETYDYTSKLFFTHASPTLFNSGLKKCQLASCFLMGVGDSIEGIFKALKKSALVSQSAGGLALHVSDIRCKGSPIAGTGGKADGVVPVLSLANNTVAYVKQSGKRNGSIATYIEPWHGDIEDVIQTKAIAVGDIGKNNIASGEKTHNLFLALWIPDIFMKRVKQNQMWSLMCPNICKGLTDAYGEEFDVLYESYEKEGKFIRKISARKLWMKILNIIVQSGQPYVLFKDSCNKKSNQKNIGTIKSSNLCTEIIQVSHDKETAVCNLASICLPKFVQQGKFDLDLLGKVTRVVTRNLNKVIDVSYYPEKYAKKSNKKHRPMGIGVQGLADVYAMMGFAFNSKEANEINERIFETIYYYALLESNQLAIIEGPYETFAGSPFSEGILQYHMWGFKDEDLLCGYDWPSLINSIKTHGVRNSLLTALMPTATTAQVMGNNECFEPYCSNFYTRSTKAGEFTIINKHMVKDLIGNGYWTDEIKHELKMNNGLLKDIKSIPDKIKNIYRTAYEMGMKDVIDQSITRAKFIDQSQSLNLFSLEPNITKLSQALFYAWEKGLKTGMYYLKMKPAALPIQFGLVGNNPKPALYVKNNIEQATCINCSS